VSNLIFSKDNQNYGKEYFNGNAEIMNWLNQEAESCGLGIDSYSCVRIDEQYFDFHAILKKD
jgi:hypothetical protein